jgi:hypothetical protein
MAETRKESSGSNGTGYRNPPVHTRFKKGQSGNQAGRPKGRSNLAAALEKELKALVIVNENGKRKTVTKFTAALRQFVNKAASGDLRAIEQLLAVKRSIEALTDDAGVETLSRESDQEILKNLAKRIKRVGPEGES